MPNSVVQEKSRIIRSHAVIGPWYRSASKCTAWHADWHLYVLPSICWAFDQYRFPSSFPCKHMSFWCARSHTLIFAGPLAANGKFTAPPNEIVSKILCALTGKEMVKHNPYSFMGSKGTACVKCNIKSVHDGYLYPTDKWVCLRTLAHAHAHAHIVCGETERGGWVEGILNERNATTC